MQRLSENTIRIASGLLEQTGDPASIRHTIVTLLGTPSHHVLVCGDIFNRFLIIQERSTCHIVTTGEALLHPLFLSPFFAEFKPLFQPLSRNYLVATSPATYKLVSLLASPNIELISLFKKDVFPLPRFALGISDIAYAVRKNFIGQVHLTDMQFGISLNDIKKKLDVAVPGIIGISATFGQHDILEELVEHFQNEPYQDSLVVVGGSLAALNKQYLLQKFPTVLIANGYGETTMQDIVLYWHHLKEKSAINNISYSDQGVIRTTPQLQNDKYIYCSPELDLLSETLSAHGVIQLESSRGCTYSCSFCPRGHKGKWSGNIGKSFGDILPYVAKVYDQSGLGARKIFLVDEEFLGYSSSEEATQNRALEVAANLKKYNFRFESSTRIDQVFRPRETRNWHEKRIGFWRELKTMGLDRMLFGLESGVDSILQRFAKKTSVQQNVQALRILTAIGIPIRITYITFDPLMSLEELIESYRFQGRRDILLNESPGIDPDALLSGIVNPEFIEERTKNEPVYTEISYMLVSMESLMGSKYLQMIEAQGLAGEFSYAMGRRQARYINPDIGSISRLSQIWIDRNFSFDYVLKSMIKISEQRERRIIKGFRRLLKDAAYELLGSFLFILTSDSSLLSSFGDGRENGLPYYASLWKSQRTQEQKENILLEFMNKHMDRLRQQLVEESDLVTSKLPGMQSKIIQQELRKWQNTHTWKLINK